MRSPLNYTPLRITQGLHHHCSIDIGSPEKAPFHAMEEGFLLRNSIEDGVDGYGNHYTVYKGKDSGYTYTYVHGRPIKTIVNGSIIIEGQILALTAPPYEGNSRGCHMHLRIVDRTERAVNPFELFNKYGIKYKQVF